MPDLDMKISGDLVKGIIDQKIKTAIAVELGRTEDLISLAVDSLMTQKVDSDGKVNRSEYLNTFPMVEGITRAAIRDAVRAAIQEWVEEQMPALKAQVAKELQRKANGLAAIMVKGLGESLHDPWRMSVSCKFSGGGE